jgi:hypothetical protein
VSSIDGMSLLTFSAQPQAALFAYYQFEGRLTLISGDTYSPLCPPQSILASGEIRDDCNFSHELRGGRWSLAWLAGGHITHLYVRLNYTRLTAHVKVIGEPERSWKLDII